MARLVEISGIDTNIFCTNEASGGHGGDKKMFVNLKKGAVMTKIQAWKEGWLIKGVEMTMSDHTIQLFGTRNGHTDSFDISPGETLTSLYTQASGKPGHNGGYRLGGISMVTSKGRKWEFLCTGLKDVDKYWYNDIPNSGIVCGLFGKCGDDVDCLGFAVLNPIKSVTLIHVTYPQLAMQPVNKSPTTVATDSFVNESPLNQSFTLEGRQMVTTERSWSAKVGFEMSVAVTVSAGIPEVIGVGSTAEWRVNAEAVYRRSVQKTREWVWKWTIVCPPHSSVDAAGSMFNDDITTKYKAELCVDLANGHKYEYAADGIYTGMDVSRTDVKVESHPL